MTAITLAIPGAGPPGAATPEHEHLVRQIGHSEIGGIEMNAELYSPRSINQAK